MEQHPFSKIKEAKEHIGEQRKMASHKQETLNPSGKRSEMFQDMIGLFDSLGLTEETEGLGTIRQQYEAKIRRKVLKTYNEFLGGKKGSPTHHDFSQLIEKKFVHGFNLYLSAVLRLDMTNAPSPHKPSESTVRDGGRLRTIREVDKNSESFYQRNYLAQGNSIELPEDDDEHSFDRTLAMQGYAKKYQQVFQDDEQKSAEAAYMFEKFRSYEENFFENLRIALSEGVDLPRSVDFATFSYGLRSDLINEMKEYGLSPEETVRVGINNRTSAEFVFDTYKRVGQLIEKDYPYEDEQGNKHSWVRGPKVMRHYILKYPETIEAGVKVVDTNINVLQQEYPHIPQRILIEKCLENPSDYNNEINKFLVEYEALIEQYEIPKDWMLEYQGGQTPFNFFHVGAEAMVAFFRSGKSKVFDDAIKNTSIVVGRLQDIAAQSGAIVPQRLIRNILRNFLLRNISLTKATEEAKRIFERETEELEQLYELAEELYPEASDEQRRHYVELGYGESPEDIIETGKVIVDLMSENKNPAEADLHIEDCIELYYRYLDAGFPQDEQSLQNLKDAISMDAHDPKSFFEDVLKQEWPEYIPLLKSRLEDIE